MGEFSSLGSLFNLDSVVDLHPLLLISRCTVKSSTAVQVKQCRQLGQSGYRRRCKEESNEGEQSRIKDYGKQMALSPKA
jgi:hypothetical protein